MNNWNKTAVTMQQIDPLCKKYNIDQILASILVRRGITQGKDVFYYLEDDLRFQHSPFLLTSMEDAVERILQAKDDGEKVLIFGDKDADGVTSTAILYEQLVNMGIEVETRLPLKDDAYGLSMQAVEEFAAKDGTLIITVDCGISNFDEIKRAVELGIDVIVTDHHNPPDNLPEATIIVDPKTPDSGYPFADISGAAVAYKLVSALRFATTDFYNSEVCFMTINEDKENNCFSVECIKVRNLCIEKKLTEKIFPGKTSIYDLKLPYFLQGKVIYVWDAQETGNLLKEIFGSGIEFNLTDFRHQICPPFIYKGQNYPMFGALGKKTENELSSLSTLAKYIDEENSVIQALYNLYVTYCKKIINITHPTFAEAEKNDIQLVALAALADIMPMKNENRIFVRSGLKNMKIKPRNGIAEILNKLGAVPEQLNSTFLSWNVTPVLNAAGRLGKANVALDLLINQDSRERLSLCENLFNLNDERKQLVNDAMIFIQKDAEESVARYNNKICLVIDEKINKGVTGILANRLMQDYNVPAIAITMCDGVYVGSLRSFGNFISTNFLDSFGDIYINHGGHDYAAGFSFEADQLPVFLEKLPQMLQQVSFERESTIINIDAELPANYLTPEIGKLIETFEPYGAENNELIFLTNSIPVFEARKVGKTEVQHLKLTFDCGKYKYPAIFYNNGERLGYDIFQGNSYSIVYNLNKNYYNGRSTDQMIIKELR